jgi:hypothetical protein
MQKNTVRTVLAQVLVCKGCCCGNIERGKPEVPVDWLKAEWKKQGLLKRIHLTITGCLGPCDIPNVVSVVYSAGSLWLGGITTRNEYQSLIDWAIRCRDGGHVQDFPRELTEHRVSAPFLSSSAGEMTAL